MVPIAPETLPPPSPLPAWSLHARFRPPERRNGGHRPSVTKDVREMVGFHAKVMGKSAKNEDFELNRGF